jgi:sugar lactone lactonase YvrE
MYPRLKICMILLLHLSLYMLACRDTSNENHKQQSKVTPHTFNKNNTNMAFENFTVEDGISDNDVTDMIEDKDGVLWFGTAKGLTRYDGIEFKSYPEVVVDGKKRGVGVIDGLCLDSQGLIWMIEANRGIMSMNPLTEKVISYEDEKVASWNTAYPRRLYNNGYGNV